MRQLTILLLLNLACLLSACGGGAGTSQDKPPKSNAGADQTVNEGAIVALIGSASSGSGGNITSYTWAQLTGPTVSLTNASSNQATFTAPPLTTATSLEFRLTVTDAAGKSGSDNVTITVNPVNAAPTANAGVDRSANARTSVALAGSGSDSDGSIATYAWAQIAGTSVTLSGADTASPSFTAPIVADATALSFRLTVTDNEGANASDEVTITVVPVPNQSPVANAGDDQSAEVGASVALIGSGSDPDGSVASYAWTQIEGAPTILSGADSSTLSFTAPTVTSTTTLTFRLTVTDNEGASTTDEVSLIVHLVGADSTDWNKMVWGEGGWG